MQFKIASISKLAACAALLLSSGAYAGGSENFDLTFSGSGFDGSIDLTGTSIGGGEYDITSATGTIDGLAASLYTAGTACTAAICGAPSSNGNPAYYTPSNPEGLTVVYDNVLYTGASAATNGGLLVDAPGLAFITSASISNIYGAGSYQYTDQTFTTTTGVPISVNLVTAVPEPSTYLMMMLGLMGIGYVVTRKNRIAAQALPLRSA